MGASENIGKSYIDRKWLFSICKNRKVQIYCTNKLDCKTCKTVNILSSQRKKRKFAMLTLVFE